MATYHNLLSAYLRQFYFIFAQLELADELSGVMAGQPQWPHLVSHKYLGGLFGGNLTSKKRHVKHMAKALLQTCPDSWTVGYGPRSRAELMRSIESSETDFDNTVDIFCILKYRFDTLYYADVLIAKLNIPKPDSKYCFEFDWKLWHIRVRIARGNVIETLREKCFRWLLDLGVHQRPTIDQGKGFLNTFYYVTAAIVDVSETLDDAEAHVTIVHDITNQHMLADMDYVQRASSVREQASKWLSTIGRKMRELSPKNSWSSSADDKGESHRSKKNASMTL
jgi:hypothetical protein